MRIKRSFFAVLGMALLQPQFARADFTAPAPTRPEYLANKPGAFTLPPVPEAASAAEGGNTVVVNQILFRGNTVIPTTELAALAAPYIGKPLNSAALEELRQKLTRYYVDRGYVNSGALLKDDALVGDRVTFDIIEGKLKEVRLQGMGRLHQEYILNRLQKSDDTAFNLDTLRERFQLLLDDPLFARLNARVLPDSNLGEAVLDIDVTRALPYQLTAYVNNYRPPSIGSNAVGLSGWVRDLTGYGDVLNASVEDSTRGGDSGRYSIDWHMPLNQSGTQLFIGLDHGNSSVIEEPVNVLNIQSTLDSKDVGLSQVLFESLRHKLTFGIDRVIRENDTTLGGQAFSFTPGEPDGVTKIDAWRFWQEYTYRTETQALALRSTFTEAHNNVQPAAAGLPSAGSSTEEAQNQYHYWLGQLQYSHEILDNGAQVVTRINVQQTDDVLLPLDQLSIGGAFTVRGYRENQLVADTGSVLNLELEYPLVKNDGKGLNFTLIPFYDWGKGKSQGQPGEILSSVGLATRVRWDGWKFDLAVAKRLSYPDIVNTESGTLQDKGIHFQLAYDFF